MLLDALVGVFVLAIGTMSVFSLVPAAQRAQSLATEEARAAHMATRMLEQLQQLKPTELNASVLTQLGLVDTGQSASPYSFTHVPLDDATGMSPAKALRAGTGTFTVTPIAANSMRVDLTLAWTSASGKSRTLRTGTIVGGYK